MTLYVVSTPLGNLSDITLRALEILKTVDGVIAEDTRRAGFLLHHYGIKKPFFPFCKGTEFRREDHLIELLCSGKSLAFLVDAGTPCIHDPGYHLVRKALEKNIRVTPLPGPCAVTTALSVSGFCGDQFTFFGFLPKKQGQREKLLQQVAENVFTSVLYESPHRMEKTLYVMKQLIPNRNVCIFRELTKKFEECIRGKMADIAQREWKGELTVVVEGKCYIDSCLL